MKLRLALPTLSLALFACHALAQAPAGAPAGATGQCKDGTYSTAASKSGACGGHKGVQTWYAAAPAKAAPAAKPAAPAPAPAPAAASKPAPTATKPGPAPAAASTAGAPAGANGQCNDGTYSTAASKSGACGGHKGVKTWFGASTAPAAPAAAAKPAASPAPAAASDRPTGPTQPAANIGSQSSGSGAGKVATTAPAAGGGPGMVWVNIPTKVYHCPTDRYYGKTKSGKYVTEAAAVAEGDKPDAGKACK